MSDSKQKSEKQIKYLPRKGRQNESIRQTFEDEDEEDLKPFWEENIEKEDKNIN